MIHTPLFRLLVEALRLSKGYRDSNPEVGMGPSLMTLLSDICESAELELTDDYMQDVVAAFQTKYPKEW